MAYARHLAEHNPLLFITIKRNGHTQRLCRAVSRIWESPEFLIKEDVRSALGHLIEHNLQGHKIRPDIMIIDLETCRLDAQALFHTVRSISGLRHVPVVALIDTASADARDATYDAGADLVVAWEKLESRIGDIAGLAVDNWLNTEPKDGEELQTG